MTVHVYSSLDWTTHARTKAYRQNFSFTSVPGPYSNGLATALELLRQMALHAEANALVNAKLDASGTEDQVVVRLRGELFVLEPFPDEQLPESEL